MKSLHAHSIIIHIITGTTTSFSSSSLFISAEMSFDQVIKDLQAQNAQFQQMFISLEKGQEDLKALILKEKKKKKAIGILNMGRRFENQARRVIDFPSTSDEGVGKGKGVAMPSGSEAEEEEEEEDEDYSEH